MMTSSKENDVTENLTIEFWSPIVGDLFAIVTNLYKLSINGITGGGAESAPPPMTTKVKFTPCRIGLTLTS